MRGASLVGSRTCKYPINFNSSSKSNSIKLFKSGKRTKAVGPVENISGNHTADRPGESLLKQSALKNEIHESYKEMSGRSGTSPRHAIFGQIALYTGGSDRHWHGLITWTLRKSLKQCSRD